MQIYYQELGKNLDVVKFQYLQSFSLLYMAAEVVITAQRPCHDVPSA
jgi:hypothetical protein